VLAPVDALAADAKPIRIKAIETFTIEMPATQTEIDAGVMNRAAITRVVAESGVKGYSFSGAGSGGRGAAGRGGVSAAGFQKMQKALVGADLFAVEQHLHRGLIDYAGIEEAIWDAIGKVAGQPVYRLLGGSKTTMPIYITAVWRGNPDQSQVPIKDQAVYARRLKEAGFNGLQMRIFRPNFMDDVDSCAGIIAACGPAPAFKLMVDRTAASSGSVWDYSTGLAAAKALQAIGVYWLEEPFARDDFEGPARLCREVDITITGGEGWRGLDPFREGLVHETYDIFQPDCRTVGGILTMRKVVAMC
jgi:L-alanine-DL-glutamate epimerase-like enolase superfamily enzyme